MSLDNITAKLRQKMVYASEFRHTVLLDMGEDGVIHIDGTKSPPELTTEAKDAEVTFELSSDTLAGILDGTQDPNVAFLMQKLEVRGDLKLAMKLNGFLES